MKRNISGLILHLFGWSLEETKLTEKKCIIIGAPHTSNWDFPIALLGLSALNIKTTWVAKESLFKGPFKYLFTLLSGIPVNRKFCLSFLDEISYLFKNNDNLKVAMMPEGTRSKKDHWKFGFYYIATKENIPISLGYIDYKNKILGIGKVITPSGNITNDLNIIQNFYSDKVGLRPLLKSDIHIKNKDLNKIIKLQNSIKPLV